ncbi:MAG: serine/threonine-protein kinase PknK, partial [Thermodesulfobacteriota bacterium]
MISVPGYRIEDELYQSSRHTYYRGARAESGEKVIIKSNRSINPPLKDISQIRHEYRMLKQLNIEGVIPLQAKVKHTHGLALIAGHFEATPLTEVLRGEKIEVVEALQIALSLIKTIGALHQHNIIHKDIQPENIFVDKDYQSTWVVDFSVASFLPKEVPNIRHVGAIEGNLAYISPEQTGRMNRPVDYRTDFYSLGMTMYEMLTGSVPFNVEDPLQMVHSHLAKQPLPPHQIDSKVPNVVSEIVLKLLSKNAEERYQSTVGIRLDLEICIRQLIDTGFVERFTIGENDRAEKFQISQKLYGRETELEILLRCFSGASQGAFEFLTISGYSGIGKTSLVRELYKPVTRERGYFITGKFDKFHKNTPYSALVSAFEELIGQILTESDHRLEQWRERVREALGTNSQVITEVIPHVEKLIGPQPTAKPLGGEETQRRFNRNFLNFLGAFCSPDHPLVIFLDDLQWIDPATLELIDLMLRSEELHHLLLIGAYRDNEVTPAHPLMISLTSFQEKNYACHNISLAPLERESVSIMIADSMQSTAIKIQPLASIVFSKTHGNPFFVNQFLNMLYQEKIIRLGRDGRGWEWVASEIKTLDITDNVIDLLIYRLKRLPSETQHAIRMAACIGFQFDMKTLSLITSRFPGQTLERLKPAIQEEMIVPAPATEDLIQLTVYDSQENAWFRFQHDRIQQAAYSLVAEDDRKPIHFAIGKIFLESIPQEKIEENVFDVLSHLNFAAEIIASPEERIQLAELNMKAGLKAISSAAFEPAYTYLKVGLDLLPDPAWQTHYALALGLHQACIEAARLTGRFEEMEYLFQELGQYAKTPLDAGDAYKSSIRACMMQNKLTEAIDTAREILNVLGEELPETLSQEEIISVLEETIILVGKGPIEDLLELPKMEDPGKLMAMKIMSEVVSAVFIGAPRIFPHLVCKQVSLSYNYGNTAASAFAYAALGAILCRLFEDIEKGYRLGNLAVSLVRKLDAIEVEAKVYHAVSGYINHYKEPIRATMELALKGYRSAMESGDFEFAGYNGYSYNKHALLSGSNLSIAEKEMAGFSATIKHFKQETPFRFNEIFHQTALNLMGRSDDPVALVGEAYDEHEMLPVHEAANDRLAIIYFRFSKLMLCTYFCRFPEGLGYAELLEGELQQLPGGPMAYSLFYYFDSLVRLALFDEYDENKRKACLERVSKNQKKLKCWGEHAPDNYAQKYHLVEAELCRVQGRKEQAIAHFDEAIALARTSEFNNDEALAHESAARYWLNIGRRQFAKPFLRKACLAYMRWGATAKAAQLNEMFPMLLREERLEKVMPEESVYSDDLPVMGSGSTRLDMATIIKANQVISSEILLDKLLVRLMKHSIENAGAERGSLILIIKDEPVIAVQGDTKGDSIIFDPFVALDQGKNLSPAIVK